MTLHCLGVKALYQTQPPDKLNFYWVLWMFTTYFLLIRFQYEFAAYTCGAILFLPLHSFIKDTPVQGLRGSTPSLSLRYQDFHVIQCNLPAWQTIAQGLSYESLLIACVGDYQHELKELRSFWNAIRNIIFEPRNNKEH